MLICGPTVMQGYLNQPQATAETIVDGWLHTGDVGRLDEDGYLQLVDRIKDMIIRGGENLYPKEIETTLAQHRGRPRGRGRRPARRRPRRGARRLRRRPTRSRASTADDLLAHCRRELTRVKVPVAVDVIEALPKNPVGKIDKPTLRRLVRQRLPTPSEGPRSIMGFTTADMPPVDPESSERCRSWTGCSCSPLHWAEYGFGSPQDDARALRRQAVVLLRRRRLVVGDADLGPRPAGDLGGWWDEPIVYQKLMVWTVLLEIIGSPARGARWPATSSR